MLAVYSTFLLVILVIVFNFIEDTHTTGTGASPFQTPQVDDPPECVSAAGIPIDDTKAINAHLAALVSNSTFFSVFSVALDKPCPFWHDDDHMCVIRDCTVYGCDETEIPKAWRSPCPSPSHTSSDPQKKEEEQHHFVDRSLTGLAALVGPPACVVTDSTAWVARDDDDDSMYVDLRRNPERYTGYSGENSQRVWGAVYNENCFMFSSKCSSGICLPDTCKEERVLYRLISGLHASISMHIANGYLFPSGNWGRNVDIYRDRLHQFPERIDNLRVVYAAVLRAVAKAAPILEPDTYKYCTGNIPNDDLTQGLLQKLFSQRILKSNTGCDDDAEANKVFDESDMFIRDHRHLLPEFRNAFRNISMIMDCVGCEKCRLWGKLQFLGLGTAMRILFEEDLPDLERNDIIALFNLLYKLSTSVLLVDEMELLLQARRATHLKFTVFFLSIAFLFVFRRSRSKTSSNRKLNGEKSEPSDCTSTLTNGTAESSQTRQVNGGDSDSTLSGQPSYNASTMSLNRKTSIPGEKPTTMLRTPTSVNARDGDSPVRTASEELQKSAPRRSERLRKRSVAKAD